MHSKPPKKKRHVLKIKRVPVQLKQFIAAPPAELPTPVHDILLAIHEQKVEEIVLVDPEPTMFERLKLWFEG